MFKHGPKENGIFSILQRMETFYNFRGDETHGHFFKDFRFFLKKSFQK